MFDTEPNTNVTGYVVPETIGCGVPPEMVALNDSCAPGASVMVPVLLYEIVVAPMAHVPAPHVPWETVGAPQVAAAVRVVMPAMVTVPPVLRLIVVVPTFFSCRVTTAVVPPTSVDCVT